MHSIAFLFVFVACLPLVTGQYTSYCETSEVCDYGCGMDNQCGGQGAVCENSDQCSNGFFCDPLDSVCQAEPTIDVPTTLPGTTDLANNIQFIVGFSDPPSMINLTLIEEDSAVKMDIFTSQVRAVFFDSVVERVLLDFLVSEKERFEFTQLENDYLDWKSEVLILARYEPQFMSSRQEEQAEVRIIVFLLPFDDADELTETFVEAVRSDMDIADYPITGISVVENSAQQLMVGVIFSFVFLALLL